MDLCKKLLVAIGLICLTICFFSPVGAVLECKKTALGTEYHGGISQTVSGRTCQDWASQRPHNHPVFTNLPDGSEKEANNFCRNPDNSPKGPWCYTSDENVRWEYCDVKYCAECKKTRQGREYSGVKSVTVSGKTCQRWENQLPHIHLTWYDFPEGSQAAANNYCRNPDKNSPNGPWCYTTDPFTRWEYCDVQFCDECKKTKQGAEYNGALAKTVSGRTCQMWTSHEPHLHQTWTNFPEGSQEDAMNYCRNPDKDTPDGPWCYTTDPDMRWEYCDVPYCDECQKAKAEKVYAGTLSKTVSGRTCQAWASRTPQDHKTFTNFPEGSETAAKNYCRNPDNTPDGPWCYTTDPNVRWERCNIPVCGECKVTQQGSEYWGVKAVTRSGYTCQNWVSRTPQSHEKWTDFPEGTEELAKNYCRNPDKNTPDGPWCYTTNPNVRWEYCDVKFCAISG